MKIFAVFTINPKPSWHTSQDLTTNQVLHNSLQKQFAIATHGSRFALNPHAGEDEHRIEERCIITPALDALREEGLNVIGPHPADTLFHEDAARPMMQSLACIMIRSCSPENN